MPQYEFILPAMGESIEEATIISWKKNEGDSIDVEEILLEVATDKVDSEVPSPVKGIIIKRLFNEGDNPKIGDIIAIIETSEKVENTNDSDNFLIEDSPETVDNNDDKIAISDIEISQIEKTKFLSPLVKSIILKEKITAIEINSIKPTGRLNRLTKTDLLNFIKNRNILPKNKIAFSNIQKNGLHEVLKMDRSRKIISQHMVTSKRNAPHVTSFVESDITNVVNWRNKIKDIFLKKEGTKITFTPIFIWAIAQALKDFPMMNTSTDGEHIFVKKNINIGVAVAMPNGNLIVPVIKNADKYNLVELSKIVNDLANRARISKLLPDETRDGTYTMTNIGGFGNILGTPIINQPQAGILAFGSIRKTPSVIETPDGDIIGIRHKIFLSHSYDHRIIDGALGGMFVKRVGDYLEDFDTNILSFLEDDKLI